MKPKNFPARKLKRQIVAQGRKVQIQDGYYMTENETDLKNLEAARQQRSKKHRGA